MKKQLSNPSPEPAVYLYDIDTARRALSGVGRTWIYEQFREGCIKPVKLGSRTLIPATEIERLVAELKVAA
ncbi:helix-turn-helix domain-containing protein [Lysobacter sp. HDW10]|uniref:helix-turn-helix domain-containing protein n=1 Tax=Lysobacter sp. HDW10 TaxID=2714936 RepID=UPI0014082742|nr:helix-turn-helix domain-containing protein [Lysobacter sp. HDW10]QIK81749.1 helix-turn-helix domain-containing protein [Lysobacter sp. HDW10]